MDPDGTSGVPSPGAATDPADATAAAGKYGLYRFGPSAGLAPEVKSPSTPQVSLLNTLFLRTKLTQTNSCIQDDIHSVCHQGWMMKLVEGNNQGWKRKYVILRGNNELAYFDKPPAVGPDGLSTQVSLLNTLF